MKRLSVLLFAAAFALSTPAHAQDQTPERTKDVHPYAPKDDKDGADQRDERFSRMKREIGELRRAGKHEDAARLETELREFNQREHKDTARHLEPKGPEKLRHLMEAIRHLREAGLNETAEHLEVHARQMREEFERRAQTDTQREGRRDGAPAPEETKQVQREIQELREQVQRLNQNIEKLRQETRRQHQDKDWQ